MRLLPTANALNIDYIYIRLCAYIHVYVYTTHIYIYFKNILDL